MARRIKIVRVTRRRVRRVNKGSDDSDEEYMVGEDECNELDDDSSSFDEDESEDDMSESEEEEEKKKVGRSKVAKRFSGRKTGGVKKLRKKKRVSYREEDDEDYDDDVEFTPSEIDCVDVEDEPPVAKKNKKVGRPCSLGWGPAKGQKRKRNSKVLKPVKKKLKKTRRLRKTDPLNNEDDKYHLVEGKRKKTSGQKRRIFGADSATDFGSYESSDYEYTVSEEEREQVREAVEFCRSLRTSLRTSSLSMRPQDEDVKEAAERVRPGRKGKEKVADLKKEYKQVCGICLSEEGKETVQGTLNCCSHYFCFDCVIEWSRVESRCPLCKQRFATISKPSRSKGGFNLRTVVVPVPERNQVYQPSEEEIRNYFYPNEDEDDDVICTVCYQGGSDVFTLFCYLCGSPAHIHCVDLGPLDSWYCEACRPPPTVSATPQAPSPNNGSHIEMSLPNAPLTRETGSSSSPRGGSAGDSQSASPSSGSGANTQSDRRRAQIQLHRILVDRMRESSDHNRTYGLSLENLETDVLESRINGGRELAPQNAMAAGSRASGLSSSRLGLSREQRVENPISQAEVAGINSGMNVRLGHPREQMVQNPISQTEVAGINSGINSGLAHGRSQRSSGRSNSGADATVSFHGLADLGPFDVEKEQIQSLVKSHLKSLSSEVELGYNSFNDIARSSTHTILAACGLEHRRSVAYPIESPSVCDHFNRIMGGERTSLMEGLCSSCFDSFSRDVVREIMNARVPHPWDSGVW